MEEGKKPAEETPKEAAKTSAEGSASGGSKAPSAGESMAGGSKTPVAEGAKTPVADDQAAPLTEEERAERIRAAHQKALEIQEKQREDRLVMQIREMNVAEKVKLALRGGSEARSLLLKDSNKQVILSVLENPRISESEIVAVARNRSALDEALRIIAGNREWMKSYAVIMALVTNPKTPPGIAMKLVSSLSKKDLKLLEKNRGVSEAVRLTAKRTLQPREKK